MPLPAALQARLKKRGIIQKAVKTDNPEKGDQGDTISCPNASNPYHTCVEYCRKRWGTNAEKEKDIEKDYNSIALPQGWYRVPDPASGASYYWNTTSNQVSWLHPLDPSAEITLPASMINKENDSEVQPNMEIPVPPAPPGVDSGQQEKESTLSIGKHPSLIKGSQKRQEAAIKRRQTEKELRNEKRAREELDPMDPSSYSDAPRGSWTSGLVKQGEAKTGVDTTANGPLFQMRPYPSPGAVLRANQQLTQK